MGRGVYDIFGWSLGGEYHTQPGRKTPFMMCDNHEHQSSFFKGQFMMVKKGGNAFNVAATRR